MRRTIDFDHRGQGAIAGGRSHTRLEVPDRLPAVVATSAQLRHFAQVMDLSLAVRLAVGRPLRALIAAARRGQGMRRGHHPGTALR